MWFLCEQKNVLITFYIQYRGNKTLSKKSGMPIFKKTIGLKFSLTKCIVGCIKATADPAFKVYWTWSMNQSYIKTFWCV